MDTAEGFLHRRFSFFLAERLNWQMLLAVQQRVVTEVSGSFTGSLVVYIWKYWDLFKESIWLLAKKKPSPWRTELLLQGVLLLLYYIHNYLLSAGFKPLCPCQEKYVSCLNLWKIGQSKEVSWRSSSLCDAHHLNIMSPVWALWGPVIHIIPRSLFLCRHFLSFCLLSNCPKKANCQIKKSLKKVRGGYAWVKSLLSGNES